MQVEHHDLHHEFPERHDAIQVLKRSNAHFSRLFDSCHRLAGRVEDLAEYAMPVADFTIEAMKKRCFKLMDELCHMLLAFRAAPQQQI